MILFTNTEDSYIYDGTIEGLLSVIHRCCGKKIIPSSISTLEKHQENLFNRIIEVETDYNLSQFVNDKLMSISDYSFYLIYTAFLSGTDEKELIILKYFIETIKHGRKINGMKNNEAFISINSLCKKVTHEAHRFTGFVRFKELPGNVLYSVIEPDHNIMEYLMKHFSLRLKNEHFIIYDKKREFIAAYNTKDYNYFTTEDIDIKRLEKLSLNDEYEELWKRYFDTIAIKERTNKKCQMGFMPKKYWKNMLEMEDKL